MHKNHQCHVRHILKGMNLREHFEGSVLSSLHSRVIMLTCHKMFLLLCMPMIPFQLLWVCTLSVWIYLIEKLNIKIKSSHVSTHQGSFVSVIYIDIQYGIWSDSNIWYIMFIITKWLTTNKKHYITLQTTDHWLHIHKLFFFAREYNYNKNSGHFHAFANRIDVKTLLPRCSWMLTIFSMWSNVMKFIQRMSEYVTTL